MNCGVKSQRSMARQELDSREPTKSYRQRVSGGDVKTAAFWAADVNSKPIRIMCMGDSITKGLGAEAQGGYRGPLQRLLKEADINFDFVGRVKTVSLADGEYEGESGQRLVRMLKGERGIAEAALRANQEPDTILLLIGINDLIENRNTPEVTLSRMGQLLDELAGYAPKARIIVGNLIPNASDNPVDDYDPGKTYTNSEEKVLEFNEGLPSVIASKKAEGVNVEWVDLHGELGREDLYDGIHPDRGGYLKMAQIWFKAVTSDKGALVPVNQGK